MTQQANGRPAQNPGRQATDIMAMFAPAGAQQFQPPQQQQFQQQQVPNPVMQATHGAPVPQNPQDNGFQTANGGMPGGQQQQPQSPAPGTGAQQGQGEQSPFDAYAGLFKIDDKAVDPVASLNSPVFAMDAEKLQQHVSKMNFANNVDPAVVQNILRGDATALQGLLNSLGQSVFQQSARFMQTAMESGFGTYNNRLNEALPAHMRTFAAKQEIARDMPFASHAGVAPMIEALQTQFMRSNPNMSPAESAAKVKQFLQTIGAQVNQQQQQPARDPFTGQPTQQGGAQQGADWDSFFS